MHENSEHNAWNTFWESGNANSCIALSEGDQGLLRSIWQDFAKPLRKGARILDLATGNGAVPLAIFEQRVDFAIDAVDAAAVQPNLADLPLATQKKIRFFSNTKIDELPRRFFELSSYDAITSQFGIEYAGLERQLPNVLPYLKPQACIQMIVHHADSALIASSKSKLQELESLMAADGLVEAIEAWLKDEQTFEQLEVLGREHQSNEIQKSEHISGQIFHAVAQLEQIKQQNHAAAINGFEGMKRRIDAERTRTRQMINVAQTESQIFRCRELFEERDFGKIEASPLYLENTELSEPYLLAWKLYAEKQ